MFHSTQKNKISSLICSICLALSFFVNNSCAEESFSPTPPASIFLEQIDLDTYGILAPPNKAPMLRWDFSDDEVYPFDFTQQTVISSDMSGLSVHKSKQENTQKMDGHGKLSLKSEGNNIARLVLENLILNMEINIPGSEEPKVMSSQSPPFVVQGMKEDGSMELGGCPRMHFCPNSSLFRKNNARNIKYMTVLIFS